MRAALSTRRTGRSGGAVARHQCRLSVGAAAVHVRVKCAAARSSAASVPAAAHGQVKRSGISAATAPWARRRRMGWSSGAGVLHRHRRSARWCGSSAWKGQMARRHGGGTAEARRRCGGGGMEARRRCGGGAWRGQMARRRGGGAAVARRRCGGGAMEAPRKVRWRGGAVEARWRRGGGAAEARRRRMESLDCKEARWRRGGGAAVAATRGEVAVAQYRR